MTSDSPSLKSIADAATAERLRYFDDPVTDDLLALVLEIAEENCVLRDRLATAKTLHPGLDDAIDSYTPNAEGISERLQSHGDYMKNLMKKVASAAKK